MPEKIGVGLTAFGMSGKVFHAPLISHHENFRLARIVERSTNEAATRYSEVPISRSIDELLADRNVDLVVVNTPDRTHHEIAKRCLEAGKHVIVEKPFTQTVEQGDELIQLAKTCGKALTVFHNRRWDGDFLTVRQVVERKLLGRLIDFESHYDRYRNFIQSGTWKEQLDSGSGLLYNLGSHMIDQALVLFGVPVAVTAHIKIMRTGGEVDDWYDVRLHYDEVNVVVKSSYLVREPGPRYVLHGTLGSFVKYGLDPQEEALKQGLAPGSPGWGKEPQEWWGLINTEIDGVPKRATVETKPGNYSAFYDSVYNRITAGTPLAVTPQEALNVIRVIEAAKRSDQTKQTVFLGRF
jgi:predicted dehydrogenase